MFPLARSLVLFLTLVGFVALFWRLVDVRDWPSEAYPTLQYESALAARSIWIGISPAAQTPERLAWRDAVGLEYVVAPPVLPAMVAAIYCLAGEEVPWVSRIIGSAFWLAGGALIFATGLRLSGSPWASALSGAWFVLCPYGMLMSRSFQTEPVLAFAFAGAVWSLTRPNRTLRWRETLLTGAACGAAAFVKPGILFFPLLIGFASIIFHWNVPGSRMRKSAHLLAFAALVCIPGTMYAALLLRVHGGRIMPHLLGEFWFYEGVARNACEVVGLPASILATIGVAMALRAGAYWPLGLMLGHFATQAVFTFHAATHTYYQVPLLVIGAVAIVWPIAVVERFLKRNDIVPRPRLGTILLFAGVAGYLLATRQSNVGPWRWLPERRAEYERVSVDRRSQAERAAEIVAVVGHGTRVIELTPGYGYPLQFDGWVRTLKWPSIEDRPYLQHAGAISQTFSAEEYLGRMVRGGSLRYFVVSDMEEWAQQPDLQAVLAKFGPPLVSNAVLVIFDLESK